MKFIILKYFLLSFIGVIVFCPFTVLGISASEVENVDILIGERLEYIFTHFGLPTAKLVIEVKGLEVLNNKKCYYVVATARPTGLFYLFRNISYHIETYIDVETYKPVKFHKRKKIGNRKVINEVIYFYYPENIAIWKYTGKKSKKIKLAEDTQDLLSILFYFRRKPLKVDSKYLFNVVYNGRLWKIYAKIPQKKSLRFHGKNISTFKIEVNSKLVRYLTKEKNLTIYFSTSRKYTPILFFIRSKKLVFKGLIKQLQS